MSLLRFHCGLTARDPAGRRDAIVRKRSITRGLHLLAGIAVAGHRLIPQVALEIPSCQLGGRIQVTLRQQHLFHVIV